MSIAAIVLAGGSSRRLGQPKQLLMQGGETLIERAIRLAMEAGAAPLLAVLGAHREVICAAVEFSHAIVVVNEEWERGLATSIHAGLRALDEMDAHIAGVLVMTCDQPRLTASHLRSLMNAFAEQPEPAIVASAYGGSQGVPAVFPRLAFPGLRKLEGDKGARVLLSQPPCPVIALPFDGGDLDIDLPSDLAHLE
jgi:CTP:molybdopterin cytidylyltransferase MocA